MGRSWGVDKGGGWWGQVEDGGKIALVFLKGMINCSVGDRNNIPFSESDAQNLICVLNGFYMC